MSGSIRSIAGGKMTFTAKKIRLESTDGDLQLHSAKDTVFTAKGKITYDEYVPGGAANPNIIEGYWTDEQDNRITEALVGDTVRFHIKTRGIPVGSFVWVSLYDDDLLINAAEDDVDDKQDLVKIGTTIPLEGGPVRRNAQTGSEEVMLTITLTGMNGIILEEPDHIPELYCRVSYNAPNTGIRQHTSLPARADDYLKLVSLPLIIDRYKMPGLNWEGTEIAPDMAYGFGSKKIGGIYRGNPVLDTYKQEYEQFGFAPVRHSLFSNATDFPALSALPKADLPPFLSVPPIDHTRLLGLDPVDIENSRIRRVNGQRKALYNKEEIYAASYNYFHTGNQIQQLESETDSDLFAAFKSTAVRYFTYGAMKGNLERMIDKFQRNEGGIYEDAVLTEDLLKHPTTEAYCLEVEDYIAEHLKNSNGKLVGLQDKKAYVAPDFRSLSALRNSMRGKTFSRPVYKAFSNRNVLRGETIALNDIWATDISITNYSRNGAHYTITYKVTLWDHFGLDINDLQKFFNIVPFAREVFATWITLQHMRGFKPFLTKITFEKTFSENKAHGSAARNEARMQHYIEELQLQQSIEPKF